MKLFLKRHSPLFISLAAMLALYIPWLNRGYLNWEWPHALAGQALAFPEKASLLNSYWATGQANPLGYPLMNSIMQLLVGGSESFWVSRVPSLIGCGLIVTWGWLSNHGDSNSRNLYWYWLILILLNPMISSFSTHATSDVLPVGLLLISFTLLEKFNQSENFKYLFFSAFAFGMSCSVRYIGPYLVGFHLYMLISQSKKSKQHKLFNLLLFGIVAFAVLLAEVIWKYQSYNVFLSTRAEQNGPDFSDLQGWLLVLIRYLSFVGLFMGPFPVVIYFLTNLKERIFQKIFLVFIALSFGWIMAGQLVDGELDFGAGFPFGENAKRFISAIGFLNFLILLTTLKTFKSRSSRTYTPLLFAIVPYLLLISASRPTQRYLIYGIPIVLMFLVDALRNMSKKLQQIAVGSTALVFASVSLLGMSYLRAQGNASEQMAVWIEENGLIRETSPGVIFPHSGQHFWGIEVKQIRYEVIAVTPEDELKVGEKVLHREPMNVLGKITRVYLLREVSKSP